MKTHNNKENNKSRHGAVGALLDIYEQAIKDLQKTIEDIPDNALTIITDPYTTDENCRSVQTILSHVVSSGYGYATSMHNLNNDKMTRKDKVFHGTIKEYLHDLEAMFNFTENIFSKLNDQSLEQLDNSLKIKTGWGQLYDIEQLTEHAIVHILRHKRQIENIKAGLLT